MTLNPDPYIIRTIRPLAPRRQAVNDRTGHKAACEAAFNHWLCQLSHMLSEWEMELMNQDAPMSAFETIAAFKGVLSQKQF